MEKENKIGLGMESIKFSLSRLRTGQGQLMNSIMTSAIVRGLGWLVCILLAFVFGVMFIIGSADLLKGKKAIKSVVTIENQNKMTGEEEEIVNEHLE